LAPGWGRWCGGFFSSLIDQPIHLASRKDAETPSVIAGFWLPAAPPDPNRHLENFKIVKAVTGDEYR